MLKGVNWIAVLVAVVLLEALGYLWYGPLFGERWMAALGKEPDTSNLAVTMSLGVVNTIIIVLGLSWLLRRLGANSLNAALMGALAAWFFFDFTTMAIDYLYVRLSGELVLINMGYQLVAYLVAGAVIGLIKPKAA
ncbi:DUF1761 domain-containing protein [Phenylobacterium sp. LH3H17]|uniref:DUF1761 domain-containing protein n=1 Tax=Phenylobacterium sp. LH3H17 TaxID=2903901 RepID=UPI0020CA1F23|nr:DUF1761 domain-containing protein [Phenylobacterium sp. LH3H17]UTP41278.1 DUF1761 domain-containing protein [Phenylobacterium sp. LH3H17]